MNPAMPYLLSEDSLCARPCECQMCSVPEAEVLKDDSRRLSHASSSTSLCLSVASNLFEDDSDDDDHRILQADLRTREQPTYKYEWDVMNHIEVHNSKPRKLKGCEEDWLKPLTSEDRFSERGTELERVDYADHFLTTTVFEERFVSSNGGLGIPCVIKHVPETDNWEALHKWKDAETFSEHYGDVALHMTEMFSVSNMGKARGIRIPVSQYIDYACSNDADFPFYPFERDFSRNSGRHRFLQDFSAPRFFSAENDLYATNEDTRQFFPWECHRSLLLGGKRTGSNLHKDPKGSGAWNTLLSGRKRWVFFPPHVDLELIGVMPTGYKKEPPAYWWQDVYPLFTNPAMAAAVGMKECIQEPGDTMWTPPNWYHAVLNLDDFTIAATWNTLSLRMLSEQLQPAYPQHFADKYPEIAAYFRQLFGEQVWAELVLRQTRRQQAGPGLN